MKKIIFFTFCLLLPAMIYSQERRVALLIGNSNYQNGAPLANPENDAKDIGEKLTKAGFDVSCHTDLNQEEMKRVIDEFGAKLDKVDVGLFFYAGHGVQAKGKNYLIPVDADLKTENDVEYNCVEAGRILAKMEDAATGTNIVILDACRNNPFERSWSRNSKGNGLAYMDAPGGSLIAYSTAPGKTASDGYSRNSPYTSGLLKFMGTPGLKVEDLFKLVRLYVKDKTGGEQIPWESTSLEGDFYFSINTEISTGNISIEEVDTELVSRVSKREPGYDESSKTSSFEENRRKLASGIRSIAIMPFANYTGDKLNSQFTFGLQDALISELGKLGSVRVTSQTSTLQYADYKKTIKQIASELNVDGVVETSLIQLGDTIRFQMKLISAAPEEQLIWSEVFDSDMNNILNLYNSVIRDIADEIQLSLTPDLETNLTKLRKVDADAYKKYLLGRAYLSMLTKESLFQAKDYLSEGINEDPEWAPLYAGMVEVWASLAQMGFVSQEIAGAEAMKNMSKALELDPDLPVLNFTIGFMNFLQVWDWATAEHFLTKAISINPNHALARVQYAHLLACLLRPEEALKQSRIAAELDPFNPFVLALTGAVYSFTGDYESASIINERAYALEPKNLFTHYQRELSAMATGNYDIAFESLSYILREGGFPEDEIKKFKRNIRKSGYKEALDKVLLVIEEKNKSMNVLPVVEMAFRFSWAENFDKAIEYFEKSYEAHDPNMPYILTGYGNTLPMKNNPRFQEIVNKMNLPLDKFVE